MKVNKERYEDIINWIGIELDPDDFCGNCPAKELCRTMRKEA